MRILHYSLGFPPYRSGGLTKFCVDLMNQQIKDKHNVFLLWPGQMYGKFIRIKKRKSVNRVMSFELINPLPIPYDEGITEIDAFTIHGEKQVFVEFLKKIKPDVIHLHTLMGLYGSFVETAKELKIKIVFTTHDFFPICPKVTMYRHGKICESVASCEKCAQCNTTALEIKQIRILQSSLYRLLKDSPFIKKLRKQHRERYLDETTIQQKETIRKPNDYIRLRAYYLEMLDNVDVMHYNSSVAQAVYEQIIGIKKYYRIPITHSDISDHRRLKKFNNKLLRIRYLGPQGGAKGFFILKTALDELWKERQDFILDVHFDPVELSPYMKVHNRYGYNELEDIFEETDVLVAPSIWYETFGYTVLEALSYGVPVIISGTVGAKDILVKGAGIVIDDISSNKLLNTFKALTPEIISKMNKILFEEQEIMSIKKMSNMIIKECYMEG